MHKMQHCGKRIHFIEKLRAYNQKRLIIGRDEATKNVKEKIGVNFKIDCLHIKLLLWCGL